MDTTSATSTPLSIKNILESVADARENLIQRLQGIEDNLNKKYGQEITALESDYTRNTKAEEEKYQNDRQKLIKEHPDDKSRLEELEKKHTETLKSFQEKLNKAVHDVKSKAIEEIIGVISGIDSRLSKDDLTFSDLGYVLNQIKAELTINSAVKFLSEWHDNIQTLSKGLSDDTGFAAKKYSELKTLLAKSEESAKKVTEGVSNVGESMAEADAQFKEAFDGIIRDFAKKITEENKTDKDLLNAIAIAHGGAEKSLEDLKKTYSTLDGVQDQKIEGALKKSIVEMLRARHKDLDKNEEALDKIADVYIKHAQSRKKLVSAVEGAESGWEKARKVREKYIAKDTVGGRLLKMIVAGSKASKEKRGFYAGMRDSIKEDVRKDYDSFFYKDATGLLGNGRAYLGAFLESLFLHKRKIKTAEKDFQKNGEEAEQKIRQIATSAGKVQPSIGTGGNSTAPEVATGKASGHAAGKRNIEDGIHVVGEKGAELLVKQGNSVSVLQIKPDVSAPASIGVSPSGASQGQSMESSAEFERKQQETEDRHSIAKHTETIVELLREGNEIAKKKETEKKGGGSLLDSLFGLLGMFKPLLKNLLKGLGKLGKFGASLFKKAGSLLGRGARGLGGALKTGGRMGLNALKGAGGLAKGILGKLGPAAMIGMGLYDAYQGWNDEDLHRRAFGLKEGEKASTGQKIQAGMASAGAGILNIGSDIASFFGMDSLAEKIRIDPATLAQAYQTPLKSFGKMITGLTDGVPILGDAVKGLGDFIDSSPMLKGAVDWLDDHNPTKLLTEGIGSAVDWISSDHKWEDVKKGCGNILGTISGGMSDLWKGITGNFSKTNDWLKKKSDVVFNFIKEYNPLALILKGYEKIKGFVMEKYQKITSWWEENNPFNPIINFFTSIGEFFKSLKLSSMLENVLDIPGRDYLLGWLRDKGLASGAYVRSSSRGTLAVIGEGKEDEAVMPISKLARFALESFDLLEGRMSGFANADTHHGDRNADMLANMRRSLREEKKLDIPSILISIDETAKDMQKNLDSICKMVRLIKVDGITLGEMLDHPMTAKVGGVGQQGMQTPGAQAGAGQAQYGAGNPQLYAGDSPSGNAAPFVGGKRAPGIGGRYGAIAGKRDELVLAKPQRALNARGKHMDWSQATNNPGNVGNTDQGGTYIFPDLQSGLKAQRDLLKERYTTDGRGNRLTLTQMCQKYTPTCWRTALPTWSKYSGIGVNEVPNLDDPQVMARLMKAIHIAEGSASWVSPDEVDYALGLKQMPQGYQKKDYRQLTEKGKALLAQGSPHEQTMNPAPSPSSTPPSSVIPQAQFVPAANGDPYKQTLVPQQQSPAANPTMNPVQGGEGFNGDSSSVINFGSASAQKSFDSINPTFRARLLGAAQEFLSKTGKKIRISGPRSSRRTINEQSGIKAQNKEGYAADPSFDAPHVQGLAVDVKKEDASAMDNLGLLTKFNLSRPLWNNGKGIVDRKGRHIVEEWHIEPAERRVSSAAGAAAKDSRTLMSIFGASPEYFGASGKDYSGSGLTGKNPSVPGLSKTNPIQNTPPMAAQNTPPIANVPPTPPSGGTMQPMQQQAHTPGMGLGGQSGTPQYGGGNLASRLLGIARKNAEISGVHGYSKGNREGTNQFDCSSFVGRSLQEAGYNVGPISNFNTGTMGGILKNLGFQWHDGLDGVQPGDIVWGNGHTEIAIGGGKSIGALNPRKGVGIHPLSWHRYTGYWRDGAISQMSPEEAAVVGQTPSIQGGPNPAIPGQGGNVRDAMGGVQVPDMGQAAGPSAGPQIQGSPQAQAQQAAQAYYESGGGGNVYAPTTNVMGGGGNADKGGATFLTTKDPMSWIILQGNTVH